MYIRHVKCSGLMYEASHDLDVLEAHVRVLIKEGAGDGRNVNAIHAKRSHNHAALFMMTLERFSSMICAFRA